MLTYLCSAFLPQFHRLSLLGFYRKKYKLTSLGMVGTCQADKKSMFCSLYCMNQLDNQLKGSPDKEKNVILMVPLTQSLKSKFLLCTLVGKKAIEV